MWLCMCDCGVEKIISGYDIKNNHTKSCGCLKNEQLSKRRVTHGQARGRKQSPEYSTWHAMKRRCYGENTKSYKNYGGRGIKVCDRWLNSFENFYEDMGSKPSHELTLDRIDNNGNYELGNCRWGTEEQQRRNKRTNVWIEYDGMRMIQRDWAKHFRVNYSSLQELIKTRPFPEVYSHYIKRRNMKTDNNFFVMNIN